MSKVQILLLVIIVAAVLVTPLGYYYYVTSSRTKVEPVTILNTVSLPKSSSKPDQKDLLSQDDTPTYSNYRGVFLNKVGNAVSILIKNTVKSFDLRADAKLVCMDEANKDKWLDLTIPLDGSNAISLYPNLSDSKPPFISEGEQQIIFSEPKDKSLPQVLWIFGCPS